MRPNFTLKAAYPAHRTALGIILMSEFSLSLIHILSHMKFSCVADAPDPEQVKVAEIGVVLVQVEMSKLSRIMVC